MARGDILLKNGAVVLAETVLFKSDVLVKENKIAEVGPDLRTPKGAEVIDASGLHIAPGFIDLHIHGAAGHMFEFSGADGYRTISSTIARHGTTGFLATISALPHENTLSALKAAVEFSPDETGAKMIGIHLEGPYLSTEMPGAQLLSAIRKPSEAELQGYIEAGAGLVKLMTLAPEVDGALVDLAAAYLTEEDRAARSDGRVRFHETDGRRFVREAAPRSYDCIVADVPDPANANLNRYYTEEFFLECRRALSSSGVLALSLSSEPDFLGETLRRRNGSIYGALCRVFPCVVVTSGYLSLMAAGGEAAPLTKDPVELIRRFDALEPGDLHFSPLLFHPLLEEGSLAWIEGQLGPAQEDGQGLARAVCAGKERQHGLARPIGGAVGGDDPRRASAAPRSSDARRSAPGTPRHCASGRRVSRLRAHGRPG